MFESTFKLLSERGDRITSAELINDPTKINCKFEMLILRLLMNLFTIRNYYFISHSLQSYYSIIIPIHPTNLLIPT